MLIRYLTPLLLLALLLPAAASAQIGIPDLNQSWVEVDPGRFVIVPSGEGPTLAQQGVVIHLWMRDSNNQPIPQFPFQDIWMDDAGNGDINLCPGGSTADANTDANGYTTISGRVYGGGWTQSGMSVYISGIAVGQTPGIFDFVLDLQVNSPDINGDRIVNLSDIAIFSGDLGAYVFRSDFNHDDALDLSDISLFTDWLGANCP